MKREREDELRDKRGAPSIAFIDLSSLSTSMTLLYIVGILGFFAIIFYVLSRKLFEKPVDFTKQKRADRQQKAASKGSSGKKAN
jgi:hypothetical protein